MTIKCLNWILIFGITFLSILLILTLELLSERVYKKRIENEIYWIIFKNMIKYLKKMNLNFEIEQGQ